MMEAGAYGVYSEPSNQWEAEGRVTLDVAELELREECKAPSITTTRTGLLTVEPTAQGFNGKPRTATTAPMVLAMTQT